MRGRIYNKTVQAKKKHVAWYPTLLQEHNGLRYYPEQDLWRLEFRLRREGVKGFRRYAKPEMTEPDDVIDAEIEAEDLPDIHRVRKALHPDRRSQSEQVARTPHIGPHYVTGSRRLPCARPSCQRGVLTSSARPATPATVGSWTGWQSASPRPWSR
ncbi:MAG TPA: hypothetical protein VGP82_01755 [Ktedonobacterales bacterium]|nr:hypothetical protein [Ktedonobacterales bacterium]